MAGSRLGTFININTLAIERLVTRLAVANGFMVFRSARAFFTASDSVARINTFLVFLVTRFGRGTIIVSFAFNSVATNVGIGGVSSVTRRT